MEATQESTQPCADPRRMGLNNSGLQDQDLADIICILHPTSHSAHDAVAATASTGSQHILQRDTLDYEASETAAIDVALLGFNFGRNQARCDVLLAANEEAKRVSNCHFRIHLTGDGIIMLQDTSTNGTIVDNCRLRKTQKDNSRMLTNGSVIQVVTGNHGSDEVRFVVRIPSREGFVMQYTQNLYIVSNKPLQLLVRRKTDKPPQPVLPWSVANAYGMHWTGGSVYNVTGQIGKGAFATVYKLATKQHGAIYAAKELDKRRFMKNGILDQKVDNEMKIMRDLRHPNIVQYIDHHEHERWIYIIMEYVPGGELSTYLHSHGKIPEHMVRTITRQLLRALHYLHKRRITHRDIKPDNILISSLDPLRVKLSDFGLSKVTQEETFLKTFCGTLLYCAPEAVDMWSLGAVLYHILSGVPPFSGRAEDRGVAMLRSIMTTEVDFDILRREGVSEDGIDFVANLLERDPFARPTEKDCFKHPWIVDVADVDEYEDDDLLAEPREGLSVIGEDVEEELDASQLSLHDNYTYQAGPDDSSSNEALAKRPRIDYLPADIHYPSLPQIESFQDGQVYAERQAQQARLFGEVAPSALRSSHALGNAQEWDGDGFDAENFASSGESMSDEYSVHSIVSLPEHPFGGTAPSLMGAENLVGRLNMNSSHPLLHPQSGPVNDISTRQTSPGEQKKPMSPSSSSAEEYPPTTSGAQEETPKAPKVCARRVEMELPETASERSSSASASGQNPAPFPARTLAAEFDPELATTLDAQTGQAILDQVRVTEAEPSDIVLAIPSLPNPPKVLGRLKSLPGSALDLNIRLEGRMTSWGRGPQATIRYEDVNETRIPAYALEITFWAPGLTVKIAEGQDWMQVPGVMAVLSTKTRKCIWVNGTELRRGSTTASGREEFNFGKLYTGDIITVFKGKTGSLHLRCEFFHGESANPRPAHEAGFHVRRALDNTSDGANRKANRQVRPKQEKQPQAVST
ncbi:hypothetical protein N7468_006059 [Penicillium chermesinum]|uniref:Protein kinase n=1 Tax=Penicillium chermesinum TaxID=63820 RepID=A0A9W9P0F9_9EURO|nr:uncharacterized protein N7468_006059 [Penicillium chermesinum]KAJ5233103.1 hypothetical protein N7468_006059 [Penicillium chermesinum]